MAETEQGRDLVSMAKRMFEAKRNWDTLNNELAVWFYPARADFTQEITLGEEFADHLADSTSPMMLRDLANAMGTMMRPADQDWFRITVGREEFRDDIAAKRKLESMTRVTRRALYAKDAMYTNASKQADLDFACFGCSVKSIVTNQDNNGLFYQSWHLRDCVWKENDWGIVDTLFRKVKMTARGMASRFGIENCPEAVRVDLDNNRPFGQHDIFHCAMPIDMYKAERKMPDWAEFVSVYVAKDGTILQDKPEPDFPYVVSRWQTVAGWDYGFSPATMTAVPDARLIQRMAISIIEASEKSTEPPLVATSETIQGPVDLTAGAITWIDAEYDERLGAAVRPLDLGKNAGVGQALMDQKRAEHASLFYLDKFSLPDTRNRTATEVRLLYQEFIRSTLPIFEPMESEVVGRELDLTVTKLLRLGAYGDDFPDSLQGQDIEYEFQNPLREARDRLVVDQFQETISVIGAAAQFDPSVLNNVNTERMFRDVIAVTGKSDWLLTEEETQQAQAASAQQEQEQALLQQLSQGAQVANEVGTAAQTLQQVTGEQ